MTDAELLRHIAELLRADREADLREVDVLAALEGERHVVVAVRSRRRAYVVVAPRPVGLVRVVDPDLLVRIEAALEGRRRGDDLHRRARRIEALRDAVDERPVLVVVQLAPRGVLLLRIDERARVEGREAQRGEDPAGLRIERDDRASPPAEGRGRGLLHLGVEAEDDRPGLAVLTEVPRLPLTEEVGWILADERLLVRALGAGRAVLEGGVPDDLGERAIRVAAPVRVALLRRIGERAAARVDDPAARTVADGCDEPRVERIGVELGRRDETP